MWAPHCGQQQLGSCTTRSRGRCSGNARERGVRSTTTRTVGLAAIGAWASSLVEGELELLDLTAQPLRGAAELHALELGDEQLQRLDLPRA